MEKIQLRIEILQQEITSFFSSLRKINRQGGFDDPLMLRTINKRTNSLRGELKELDQRFQTYKRELV